MLNVKSPDDADALFFESERVLPTFCMRSFPEIVVCELVEDDDIGFFANRRFVIKILKDTVADLHLARRNARQAACDTLEIGPSLRFNPADDDSLAVGGQSSRVLEETASLARSGRTCDIDHEPRAPAELAQQLLGSRRAIHCRRLRAAARRLRR